MKKITIVLDGVADRPNEKLGGKTPLEYAKTPNLDALYQKSTAGVVRTIPPGLEIGSAVANLSLLGFDPHTYRGRAIIEAAGLDFPINEDDLYIRCNMVTLEGDSFENSVLASYSAHEISTELAEPIANMLAKDVFASDYSLRYCGSFRNILIVKDGKKLYPVDFMAAHDIIGQPIASYIRHEGNQAPFFDLMERAYEKMQGNGTKANGLWFWGASIVPEIKGDTAGRVVLSETLLMNGITKIAGLRNIETEREGMTFDTFLEHKLENALSVVNEYDDIYVHIQEPDDLSHELMPVEKAASIESFDRIFLPRFLDGINGEYSLTVSSDHFTFSDTGGHGGDPVPFMAYNSAHKTSRGGRFTEAFCQEAGTELSPAELRRV